MSPHSSRCARGYSLLEVMVVVGITMVIMAASVPMIGSTLENFRLGGDAHNVTNAITVAKMRAAATFSRARLYVDLSTNSFHVETWNSTTGVWTADGGTLQLNTSDTFGLGGVPTAPLNTQTVIGQASACLNTATPPAAIGNTACIVFNSRGIPVDATTLNPTGDYALYLTDNTAVYGSTVSATGSIRLWRTRPSTAAWTLQ